MFARAAELSDSELAARYRGLKWISWYVSAVEGNVRMRAAEGGEFAEKYFQLREGKPKRAIDKVSVAFQNLSALGVTAEDFTAVCDTSIKAVTALVKRATDQKGKELKATVDKCLEGAVKLGKPPQRLAAVGEVIEDDGEEGDCE
jgi:hypothetical protein